MPKRRVTQREIEELVKSGEEITMIIGDCAYKGRMRAPTSPLLQDYEFVSRLPNQTTDTIMRVVCIFPKENSKRHSARMYNLGDNRFLLKRGDAPIMPIFYHEGEEDYFGTYRDLSAFLSQHNEVETRAGVRE